jgi:hypothetical protein
MDAKRFSDEAIGGTPFGEPIRLMVERQGQYLEKYVIVGITPDLPRLSLEARNLWQARKSNLATTSGQAAARQDAIPLTGTTAIQIANVKVVPSQVSPNGNFHVDIRFTVTAPGRPAEIPITLNSAIYSQDKLIYQPPPDTFTTPNGKPFDVRKKLSAGPQSGQYTIRIRLTGDGSSAEISAGFAIQ